MNVKVLVWKDLWRLVLLVQSASPWLTYDVEGVVKETQEVVVPVETIERQSLPEERIG